MQSPDVHSGFFMLFFFYFCPMKESGPLVPVSRIAPTPSGYLHVGNAFSFVLTWLLVRKAGGQLLLRIDDSDAARSRPEFIDDIFYTLDWLGIDYDLGPAGPDDFYRHFSQQHRAELYSDVLRALSSSGKVYACSCSRKQIRQQNSKGIYTGSCRKKGLPFQQKNTALRVQVPEEEKIVFNDILSLQPFQLALGRQMGDFVVQRKDDLPAYQLVSLADDMHYGVNLIVRGSDLLESTAAQLYLAHCLNSVPNNRQVQAKAFLDTRFCHHGLIRNEAGEKLSKSRGAAAVMQLREAGIGPEVVYQRVASYAGLEDPGTDRLPDLLEQFNIARLQQVVREDKAI